MTAHIRPFTPADLDALIALTLAAFEPVFVSFERIDYTDAIGLLQKSGRKFEFPVEWGLDLQTEQHLCVAEADGKIAGFIAYEFHEDETGEVYFLAVHPEYQNQGIGTELNLFALDRLKEGGAKLAVVATGGDESHAPARRSYEKAGYTGLPLVRYYKYL
ncbi:MAG: Asparagine--tRNA ligase [Chloroflexi bacterium ADurb.Bin325]|nr:MAG: Asparagine--tRNA ligase [Chloroflexi bacterium ADurb.Bin325]